MSVQVRRLTPGDLSLLSEHFARHRAESGRGERHFMPYAPDDPVGPRALDAAALDRPVTAPGWQRCFIAVADDTHIVGHVDLTGDQLKSVLHRCELGIGIERAHRGQGLGRRLMNATIDFARGADTLRWVDLRVFGHNSAARALYSKLGFVEVGTLIDQFRIEGDRIDDVLMTLDLEAIR